jgi:hypothetical protein
MNPPLNLIWGIKKPQLNLTPAFLHEKNTVTTVPFKRVIINKGFELLNKGISLKKV